MFYWQRKACLRNVRPSGKRHHDAPCQDYCDGFGRPCLQLGVGGAAEAMPATWNQEPLCLLGYFVIIAKKLDAVDLHRTLDTFHYNLQNRFHSLPIAASHVLLWSVGERELWPK